jgi:hypothetical protein
MLEGRLYVPRSLGTYDNSELIRLVGSAIELGRVMSIGARAASGGGVGADSGGSVGVMSFKSARTLIALTCCSSRGVAKARERSPQRPRLRICTCKSHLH